jgi:hypothetical protein
VEVKTGENRPVLMDTFPPALPPHKHHHNARYAMKQGVGSGAENTTNMHSKTSPTQLEGSRGTNSDPKIRDFHAGNRPVKSPPRPV